MPPEIVDLVDTVSTIIIALAPGAVIGFVAGMTLDRYLSDKQRHARRAYYRSRSHDRSSRNKHLRLVEHSQTDSVDQLRIVLGATFSAQPLLNKREARLFQELDRMVIDFNPAWQVMAQVSLGEVLRTSDAEAYSCINAKRVDLLLMDPDCKPRHAIEYQGSGHHQSKAAARDAVKKEALRRAGIGYHEILEGQTTPSDLRRLVERLVDPPQPPSPDPTQP